MATTSPLQEQYAYAHPHTEFEQSTLPQHFERGSQPGASDTAKESYFNPVYAPNSYVQNDPSPSTQRSWTRWPFLLLSGLLIAIIAGLMGGLIGRAIEDGKHDKSNSGFQQQQPGACSTTTPSPSTTGMTATNPTDVIAIPKTGCPDVSGRILQTNFLNITYKLYCNVNWVGSDIASVYAPTISDCVEACNSVNQYNLISKSCVGTTYIPQWVNRTIAIQRVGRASNCFLKYSATGYPANTTPFEAVVMCIEGKCPQDG